jgi:hypothetical protein
MSVEFAGEASAALVEEKVNSRSQILLLAGAFLLIMYYNEKVYNRLITKIRNPEQNAQAQS